MRKISGQVVSTKPVSLSRAAKLMSRFAAVDNGSTPAVSLYLERTAEVFNLLVQFHKRPYSDFGDKPDRKRVERLQSDWLKKNLNGENGNIGGEERKDVIEIAETNPRGDEAKAMSEGGEERKKKKKKKKKREGESVDSGEQKNSKKKKKIGGPDS